MSKKQAIIGAVVLALVSVLLLARRGSGNEDSSFRFVTVELGDLEQVVSATGKLDAVTTVQVGTQVSGIINDVYVDFNDEVEQGQIIARLDRTLLEIAVNESRTSLARSQAQYEFVDRNFERTKELFERHLVSESEFDQAEYDMLTARTTYESSRINLERAQRNLGYATIYAPISGKVIERNVDPGQTVAASLSTPQLFLIANDLSEMQILASVDESDIGFIEEGQHVRFTVQAYPDDMYSGTVAQVRLQSKVQENVVNYTVVVDVSNDDGTLLPGMTATVEFLVQTVSDVLKVQNAALRFRPPESMLTGMAERRRAQFEQRQAAREPGSEAAERSGRFPGAEDREDRGSGAGGRPGGFDGRRGGFGGQRGEGGGRPGEGGFNRDDIATLYYLDDAGQPTSMRVRKGITDGQYTEILGRNLEEGLQVIAAITAGSSSSGSSTNPFQPQQQGGGRGRGGARF
ncbi:MAG: efflux RND transporter periplasmic adaptor subunit [Gemmatimonadota bacterium]